MRFQLSDRNRDVSSRRCGTDSKKQRRWIGPGTRNSRRQGIDVLRPRTRPNPLISFAVILCSILSAGQSVVVAQDEPPTETSDSADKRSPAEKNQEGSDDYLLHQRNFGTNVDAVTRIDKSLPKTGSLLRLRFPERLSQFKMGLNRKYGLKVGISYQSLYQKASDSLTDTDSAWGGWFLAQAAWDAVRRGRDWQGKLVLALDGRHVIDPSSNTAPGLFHLDTGSLWPTDGAFFDWDIYPSVFFWEQWGTMDRFAFRVGQLAGLSTLDPTRFDEPRSSFTTSMVASPVSIIPVGPPGLGIAFKWWPIRDSELYVRGIANDINAPSGTVDWSAPFDEAEFFIGLELGHNWIRDKGDFDHVHLTLWHADEVSTAPWPTEAGWGFKLGGGKQWRKIVAVGNYAYNTAEGGGFGTTISRQAVNLGLIRIDPFKIKGETAVVLSWGDPIEEGLRDQYGTEIYWKILLTPNLWLTPGFQYIIDPTFNPETDSFTIAQLKFSLFL